MVEALMDKATWEAMSIEEKIARWLYNACDEKEPFEKVSDWYLHLSFAIMPLIKDYTDKLVHDEEDRILNIVLSSDKFIGRDFRLLCKLTAKEKE